MEKERDEWRHSFAEQDKTVVRLAQQRDEALASVAVLVEALEGLSVLRGTHAAKVAAAALANLPAAARKFLEEREAMEKVVEAARKIGPRLKIIAKENGYTSCDLCGFPSQCHESCPMQHLDAALAALDARKASE